jgi:thioredoxin-like negative regulator of GroEL
MPEITDVTDADFDEKVLGATGPVLVDFWTPMRTRPLRPSSV